jgi:hypothetical protein
MQPATKDALLLSLMNDVIHRIRSTEENYAPLVLADFEDSLATSENPIRTAYQWLNLYRGEKHARKNPKRTSKTGRHSKRRTNRRHAKHS